MTGYLGAFIASMILAHFMFFVAIKKKRNDLADVIWGPGFLISAAGALTARYQLEGHLNLGWRETVIIALVSTWAFRLFMHIGLRSLRNSNEDVRYRKMREGWGTGWVLKTYLWVFLLQGILFYVGSIGVLRAIEIAPRTIDPLFYCGFFLWAVGFGFEAISDRQLQKFKLDSRNKGKIMDQGLWRWSRHPNYFGEVIQWWGLFVMCVDPAGVWILISPLLITFLILKVSGVPMLEKLMQSRPGFESYKKKTSIFFPWPPKKTAS